MFKKDGQYLVTVVGFTHLIYHIYNNKVMLGDVRVGSGNVSELYRSIREHLIRPPGILSINNPVDIVVTDIDNVKVYKYRITLNDTVDRIQ